MAATDDYISQATGLDSPLANLALVTPSDTVDLAHVSRVIYIGAAGTLAVTTEGGETLTIASGMLNAGMPHKLRISRVFATGTTATGIMVGW